MRPRASYPYTSRAKAPRMRRSAHDVTDRVRTTDPESVASEVTGIFKGLFGGAEAPELRRAFRDAASFYGGRPPDYFACDTEDHHIQHPLHVTPAPARPLGGSPPR